MPLSHEDELRLEELAVQLEREAPHLARMLEDFRPEPVDDPGSSVTAASGDVGREKRSHIIRSSLGTGVLALIVAAVFEATYVVAVALAVAVAALAVLLVALAMPTLHRGAARRRRRPSLPSTSGQDCSLAR